MDRLLQGEWWQKQATQHPAAAGIRHRRREFWSSHRPHPYGEERVGNADLMTERGAQHISSASRELRTRSPYKDMVKNNFPDCLSRSILTTE